ncbi:alpha-2-macroglobulin family protein [Sporocytophaga myxococcoides]|uniref:alpha-2-macroglobulin family protein n=1 Tax=Sporocytophaga myxococcoides TaxID=153721 RepID=UPI00048FF2F4|nr:MG2 domain-containing protein [Sporocytophaga myxococcoides]
MSLKTLLSGSKIKVILSSVLAIAAIGGGVYWYASKNKAKGEYKFNPAFKAYVSSFTGGIISRESPIRISFISEIVKPEEINNPLQTDLFSFSPSIKGTTKWIDKSTIEFVPEEPLNPGQSFDAKFEIGEVMQMPEDLQTFDFAFQTIPQTFDVYVEGLRTYEVTNFASQKLLGILSTADVVDNATLEKVLTASQDGKTLSITWTHENDRKTHRFQVEKIQRKEAAGTVVLTWDGTPIQSETKGTETIEIPAIGEFSIVSARAVQGEEQYAEIQFSDPLDPNQDLQGLIQITDVPDFNIVKDENVLKLYPPVRQIGNKTITVNEGVKNIKGKALGKTQTLDINFEEIKPSVKLTGKGVILPSTDGLIFPFEAVSLKSVNVKVIKIFENNVTQFFQVNKYDGNSEIKRVGKVILKKNISLNNTNPNDYGKWKRYALDISTLIKTEPGAIYQIKIGFDKKDIFYSCDASEEAVSEATGQTTLEDNEDDIIEENESSYWDYSEEYYNEEYDYSERENPCHNSYYGEYRSVSRNIFASDLGIIAKAGSSGNLVFVVTDLKTTKPVEGAAVEVYDYQQQLLSQDKTNGDGVLTIDLKKKPFLVKVKKEEQIGYLKMDDQSALAVSNFDISGAKVQKGIKGFLYGERGVWRPGDSLFLTFILEDKLHNLPKNLPVNFELTNPSGQVIKKLVSSNSVEGFYNFSTTTSPEDPTGNWTATVKVGGATFSYPLKIETVMPNRLKINLDFGTDKITAGGSSLKGDLNVKWLHGAVAKNLETDVTVQLAKGETKFNKYSDFIFDDPAKKYEGEPIEIFKGRIDQDGNATVNAHLEAGDNAPGVMTANFKVRVMEEGGASSIDRFSMPYYPFTSFTGIRVPEGDKARNMLLTDTSHTIEIVSLDPNGNLVSGMNIQMELYKIEWRYWWEKGEENLSAYLDNNYKQALVRENVVTINGKAKWQFRVNYPEWGRFYIRAKDTKSGHSTGKIVFIDWPGWAGNSRERNQGGAALLSFSSDKPKYNVGETARLSIPGSSEGRALISIESGAKVLQTQWMETKKGNNNFEFKVTEEMTPNIFVNVTLIQPHAQTLNDLPIRLYGIIPITVENPQTILAPVISMKEELRPEEDFTVSIKEQNGKPMIYTLAVVDEGLLDLTHFKAPDPHDHFYAKEALGVNTWDMYDYVIGAYGERIDKILSIGGDGELKGSEGNKTNRFKPVVKFIGPFSLASGGSATHTLKMPQYVGSVKAMVVAGNPDGAYGKAEKAVPVRKPLMVLATLPRVLGPEESVALPVNIFAMTKNVKNVNVTIKANNMFEPIAESSKSITFNQPGDEVVNFYLKAKPAAGKGSVSVTAISGKERAEYNVDIDIRNGNTEITKVYENVLSSNASWNSDFTPFGLAGTNKATLEISVIPPINLGKRLRYLVHYPYGCVEQTTSSVFPQLYVLELMQPTEDMKRMVEKNVKAGIQRLKLFQLPDGGMTYWPGQSSYEAWATNYAGHFMVEAEKKGYALPQGFLNNWKKSQKKEARNWNYDAYNDDLTQAYRLYTLALAGDPEIGAMNRLRESRNLSSPAKWRLAAAYHLAGQTEVAKNLVSTASLTVKDYREMDNTYGSTLRDKAMILEVLSIMNMKAQAAPLAKEISAALSSDKWLSTQETAYCLMAITKFANVSAPGTKVSFAYSVNNSKPVTAMTDMKIAEVDLKPNVNPFNLQVKNNSNGVAYARVLLTGTPKPGMEEAAENNLGISVRYLSKDGAEIDVDKLEQGTDFIAEVSVSNPGLRGDYQQMALKQIFASGWEINNSRLDNFTEKTKEEKRRRYTYYGDEESENEEEAEETTSNGLPLADAPTYRDIRDDRVYTFFDIKANEKKTFRVMLNAAYLGRFYLPATYAEAMYDGSINATVPGKWVEVFKAGENISLK